VIVTVSAPRIDPRILALVAAAPAGATAAETTRAAGELAWRLGLPRPSYEQIRVLLGRAAQPAVGVQTSSRGRLYYVLERVGVLYEYPGPGLADWYRRYSRGLL
jgi:hypothetical protein